MERRQALAFGEQLLQLGADGGRLRLQRRHPGEQVVLEDGPVSHLGSPGYPDMEPIDETKEDFRKQALLGLGFWLHGLRSAGKVGLTGRPALAGFGSDGPKRAEFPY